jgi:hypothetical protein
MFTGWIYDHLRPHAEKVKVAHPLGQTASKNLRENGITPRQSSYLYRHAPNSVPEIAKTARPPGVFVYGSKASLRNRLL